MSEPIPTDQEKDKINSVVFYVSAGLILSFSLATIFFNELSANVINAVLGWVSTTFGSYYMLAATLYIVFVIFIAASRFGDIKLGPEDRKSTRLNSSHVSISYAVLCLKKKNITK